METTDKLSARMRKGGMLYPMMLIAAIAVIVFSVVGIATMMGWMPRALSGGSSASTAAVTPPPQANPGVPAGRAVPVYPPPPSVQAAPDCRDCGVIESIHAVEVKGESTWMGAAGGAVVGGLVGNQIGSGRGRTAATVAGAAGGAYAGTQIEPHLRKSVKYRIRVRMDDGKTRTFHRSQQPEFTVGQKVRVTDRGIVAAG